MQTPAYKSFSEFPETIKGYAAWVQQCKEWAEYREWARKRRFHALPEDKGIPVPHTGRMRWHSGKNSGKTGVIGSSRMLPHRYMDEGDKGKGHNRHIKRLERALWERDWRDEGYDYEDAVTVGEWFSRSYEWWEIEDDDYGTWVDMGCGDPDCYICEREFNLSHTEWEERYGCSLPDCVQCYG